MKSSERKNSFSKSFFTTECDLRWSDAVWRHSFPIGVFLAVFWFFFVHSLREIFFLFFQCDSNAFSNFPSAKNAFVFVSFSSLKYMQNVDCIWKLKFSSAFRCICFFISNFSFVDENWILLFLARKTEQKENFSTWLCNNHESLYKIYEKPQTKRGGEDSAYSHIFMYVSIDS